MTTRRIFKDIADGTILKEDKRFDQFRMYAKENRPEDMKPIPLSQDDSEWLRNSNLGKFLVIEGEMLP